MKIKAIYDDKVLKPLNDLSLPEKSEVRLTIKRSFSNLLDELGEPEAKEDIDFLCESQARARELRKNKKGDALRQICDGCWNAQI